MMKRKQFICCSIAFPMILSSLNASSHYSVLTEKTYQIIRQIANGTQTRQLYSSVFDSFVSQVTLSYEYYQMANFTVLLVNYVPVYSLAYRLDITLSDDVQYKGGVGGWFTKESPAYIDSVSVQGHFGSVGKVTKAFQTPRGSNQCFQPNNTNDSLNYGLSDDNSYSCPVNSDGLNTSTAECICSNSYQTEFHFGETGYKGKYICLIDSSIDIDSGVTFNSRLDFGHEIKNGSCGSKNPFYSGPSLHGGNLSFSILGAMNIESEFAPNESYLRVDYHINYGVENYLLGSFRESDSIDFKFNNQGSK